MKTKNFKQNDKSYILWFLGANVHATTGTGDTALTYACENGHTDVAEALLEHGAELVIIFHKEIKQFFFHLISMHSSNLIM